MSDRLERAGRIRSEREPQRVSEGIPSCGGSRCRRYRSPRGSWEDHDPTCPERPPPVEEETDWLWLALAASLAVLGLIILWALLFG